MNIALVPGSVYFAGANRPFYVGQGMVTSYLQGKGFSNVEWHKRDVALPSGVVPRDYPGYDDDWDEWVSATYSGSQGSLSPPVDIPWFIVHLPGYGQAQQNAAQTAPKPSIAAPWVAASYQAGLAAAAAEKARQAAAAALNFPQVAPGAPPLAQPQPDAPRVETGQSHLGAAIFTSGVVVLLLTAAGAILGRSRRPAR